MTTIELQATDLLLSATVPVIASGNANSIRVHATFDAEWDGYTKSALFQTSNSTRTYEVVLSSNGYGMIPPEVLQQPGNLFVGIKGVKGTARKNTTTVRLKLLEGAPIQVVSDPTGTVYEQLLAQCGEVTNRFMKLDSVSAGASVKFTFASRFTALITVNGPAAAVHATYLVQGYGAAERMHVATLQAGSGVTCTTSSTEEAVTIKASGSNATSYGVCMLYGGLPTVTM